jgi:hypothetical protein
MSITNRDKPPVPFEDQKKGNPENTYLQKECLLTLLVIAFSLGV